MKHIIYKNRVISALLLYLFTLLLVMYLYTHISIYFIWIIMLPIAFLSKKILGNGADLNSSLILINKDRSSTILLMWRKII